ncbi:2-oxo-4-hydroxy-4-carboxy-5-ureidoimidazoline decarboxylase [Salinisphaera sp. T31B1]|uniref:2-oxo-4-hydroxy-4-carboxy-5-ureidoimidazoline decarboxylase n=1 Tax=Salinisphaera sp. T31B1 TaxID=727963 RepID=UPI00333F75F8
MSDTPALPGHALGNMNEDRFVEAFGGVYEHSPWVARGVWQRHTRNQIASADALAEAMRTEVETADAATQMALIRAHPDLGGKLALAGGLTAESAREQAGAGLAGCSPEEYERLQALNSAYTEKFGFPFIVAVKGLQREDILAAMSARLDNDPAVEQRRALDEIHKIARFRLNEMF